MEEQPLMVTIRCAAYNHELYIRQCLEGFIMQKTNFRFEAIVHDDASTDGTAAIIREYAEKYPNIIKPIFETENQYSKRTLTRIMNEHTHGKYVTICEGDDYWTDPLKLQKQVDFLESHPDYGLVHTLAKVYIDKSHLYKEKTIGEEFDNVDQLIVVNRIVTLTTCYRTELSRCYREEIKPDNSWKMGDYPLWIYIALNSKVHFINEVTGVYRVLENSASHHSDIEKKVNFLYSTYSISRFFAIYSGKQYLLHRIKVILFNSILYAYIYKNQKIDKSLYSIMRELKVYSIKSILLFILASSKRGRSFIRKKNDRVIE